MAILKPDKTMTLCVYTFTLFSVFNNKAQKILVFFVEMWYTETIMG